MVYQIVDITNHDRDSAKMPGVCGAVLLDEKCTVKVCGLFNEVVARKKKSNIFYRRPFNLDRHVRSFWKKTARKWNFFVMDSSG